MLLDIEQITGFRYMCISGQITVPIAGYSGQSLLSVTVARSHWFHYCFIVCTIESIPVDCNHYFLIVK